MFFSTVFKLYHRTQSLEKENKKIFLMESRCIRAARHPLSTCETAFTKVNIAWPHGHSNILYLRTCTISCGLPMCGEMGLTLYFCASCALFFLCMRWRFVKNIAFYLWKNFLIRRSNSFNKPHGANNLSCWERSPPPDLRTPDSRFLTPMPCFRHNLLTRVEMRL